MHSGRMWDSLSDLMAANGHVQRVKVEARRAGACTTRRTCWWHGPPQNLAKSGVIFGAVGWLCRFTTSGCGEKALAAPLKRSTSNRPKPLPRPEQDPLPPDLKDGRPQRTKYYIDQFVQLEA
jgi:hypothetical protein